MAQESGTKSVDNLFGTTNMQTQNAYNPYVAYIPNHTASVNNVLLIPPSNQQFLTLQQPFQQPLQYQPQNSTASTINKQQNSFRNSNNVNLDPLSTNYPSNNAKDSISSFGKLK